MRSMSASSTEPDRYSPSRTAIMPMRTATSPEAGGVRDRVAPWKLIHEADLSQVLNPTVRFARSSASGATGQRH